MITFTGTFKDLCKISDTTLFDFDGEKIKLRDNRTRLIFLDSYISTEKFSRFDGESLLKIPKQVLVKSIESNFRDCLPANFATVYSGFTTKKDIREFKAQNSGDTYIYTQELTSGEELGTLISMLYFREKGYIVQRPRSTYGKWGENLPGVDDVVAWKSPILNELRKVGFIGKGCHISELACLRWLEKSSKSQYKFEDDDSEELILIEVEPSKSSGLSYSPQKGINQLFRAMGEQIAEGLYICFPVISKDLTAIEKDIGEFCQAEQKPKVGAILFSECGLHTDKKSDIFPHAKLHSEIEDYENNLKRVLINNFYFDEILEMITEWGIDTEHKGFEEVRDSFLNKIQAIQVSAILERISKAKARSDDGFIAIQEVINYARL